MRILFGVLAIFLLLTAASAQGSDTIIVPGERIGPIKLGMHIADATKILGTPKPAYANLDPATIVVPRPEGAVLYYWERASGGVGFQVQTNKLGEIYIVSINMISDQAGTYAMANGLRLGSRDVEVRSALGEPSRLGNRVSASGFHTDTLVYDKQGLLFFVNANQRSQFKGWVYSIAVFAPEPK